jgi:hypothetical protein
MKLPGFPGLAINAGIYLVILACAKLGFSGQSKRVAD